MMTYFHIVETWNGKEKVSTKRFTTEEKAQVFINKLVNKLGNEDLWFKKYQENVLSW